MNILFNNISFINAQSINRKPHTISYKGGLTEDVFERNCNNKENDIKHLRNILKAKRNLTESEKWNLVGSVKEDDCKANEEIRYYSKRGKFYEGMYSRELDRIFNKNIIDDNFVVYRGTTLQDFGYTTTDDKSIDDFFEKDKVVVCPTYMSTSLDKEYAKKFTKNSATKLLFKINVNPDLRALYVDELLNEKEKYMRGYRFNEENEVFVDRLAKLQMKDMYKEGEYTIIELDTLGHEDQNSYIENNNLKPI